MKYSYLRQHNSFSVLKMKFQTYHARGFFWHHQNPRRQSPILVDKLSNLNPSLAMKSWKLITQSVFEELYWKQYSNFINVTIQFSRWYTYHNHLVHMRSKGDNSSQREIIMSPSEHSSVTYPNLLLPPNVTTTNGGCGISGTAAQC